MENSQVDNPILETKIKNNRESFFPVKTKHLAAIINGIHTEIIIHSYVDRFFIIITQTEKLGTIVILILSYLLLIYIDRSF